jgi:quercetin dioxygenase-like cupin family protein
MNLSLRRAPHSTLLCRVTLLLAACATASTSGPTADAARPVTLSNAEGTGGRCVPASERAGRQFGRFVVARETLGTLGAAPVSWYVDQYPDRLAAEKARGARGTVVESLGRVWLLTIGPAGRRSRSGARVAEVGPLAVDAETAYTAQYMEAVFRPGMKSPVHRHGGSKAWYTLAGETCLETPDGIMVGRAGGTHVIVPHGAPMELTATGTEIRRALVLVLHDSSQPATIPAADGVPKGLCPGD